MTTSIPSEPSTTVVSGNTSSFAKILRHKIVIVGGGAAGITAAAQLLKQDSSLDIAIIEPSDKHYYQPGWTLVGGGAFSYSATVRDEAHCIPSGAKWIQDAVTQMDPDNNRIMTRDGVCVEYDYLIVCPGIQIDWHKVKGLPEALGKNGVTSNYSRESVNYTWELLRNFKGGNALFTFPSTPIKCAGAPQKIMYLADATFRQAGIRDQANITYCCAVGKIFGAAAYAATLDKVVQRKGIETRYFHDLKEIKAAEKLAVFDVKQGDTVEEVTLPYDMIHVAPPMSAPDFLKQSPLANAGGWVDVDKQTLQHVRYPNVFSLGDASSLPTSKTAAAVRGQAPVLVSNLLAVMASQPMTQLYNGYTCCPLVTSYNTTIMAEFDYNGQPMSSFPGDPTQERWDMWLVKRYVLPQLYWNRMLKGAPHEKETLKPVLSLMGKK